MYISYVTAFVPHMATGSAESSPASLSGAPFDRLPFTGSVAANWAFSHKHQVDRTPVPWHLLFPFSENVSSQPSHVCGSRLTYLREAVASVSGAQSWQERQERHREGRMAPRTFISGPWGLDGDLLERTERRWMRRGFGAWW